MDSVLIYDAFSNSFSPRTPSSGAWVQDLRQDLNLNKKRVLWSILWTSDGGIYGPDFFEVSESSSGSSYMTFLVARRRTKGRCLETSSCSLKAHWENWHWWRVPICERNVGQNMSKLIGESCSHVIQSSSRACFLRSAAAWSTACSVMRWWESKMSNYQLTWEFKIYPRFR